jgi:hypothetical protein
VAVYEEEPVVVKRVVHQTEPMVETHIVREPVVRRRVVREPARSGGLTEYALVRYGFLLLITLVILYFIANVLLPLLHRF